MRSFVPAVFLMVFFTLDIMPVLQAQSAELRACGVSTGVAPQIEHIRVVAVATDHVELTAQVEVTSANKAELHNLAFSSMRMEGDIPLFLQPLDQDIVLEAGHRTALPLVHLNIFYADVSSPKRLDEVLHQDRVHITGELQADLRMSMLERLLVRNQHPIALSAVNQEVTLAPSAVPLTFSAGVGALDVLQQATEAAGDVLGVNADSVWQESMSDQEAAWARSLLLVRTVYTTHTGGGAQVVLERMGFWIGPHLAIVPGEALRPWAFGARAAAAVHGCAGNVENGSVEVTIEPFRPDLDGAPAAHWSLTRGDFQVEAQGEPEQEDVVVSARARNVAVEHRNSSGNWATLRFPDTVEGRPLALAAPAEIGEQDRRLHLFRLPAAGPADQGSGEALTVRGKAGPSEVLVLRPLDERAFGSPVISDAGVVGMVVDENTILPLAVPLAKSKVR